MVWRSVAAECRLVSWLLVAVGLAIPIASGRADPLWSHPEVARLMAAKEGAERDVVLACLLRRLRPSESQRALLAGQLEKLSQILTGFAVAPETRSAMEDHRLAMAERAGATLAGVEGPSSHEVAVVQRQWEVMEALESELGPIQEAIEANLDDRQKRILVGFDPETESERLGLGGAEHWEWADHFRELRTMSRRDFEDDGIEVLSDALEEMGHPERLAQATRLAREVRSLDGASFERKLGALLERARILMEGESESRKPAGVRKGMGPSETETDPETGADLGEAVRELLMDTRLLALLRPDRALPGEPDLGSGVAP